MTMHFFYGLIGSFLGGVMLGPINLSVVDLTIRKNIRCARWFIAASTLVEIFQVAIAIVFGTLIARHLDQLPSFKLAVSVFFILAGLVFIFRGNTSESSAYQNNRGNFLNGFIISILNPQTIPYWIFVLALLKSNQLLKPEPWNLALLLVGVLGGKFIILSLYAFMSEFVKARVSNLEQFLYKAIGGLLIVAGLALCLRYFIV